MLKLNILILRMNLNPLAVQTSSAVFSFAINQSLAGRSKAAIIGIGNDLDLWWALSNFFSKAYYSSLKMHGESFVNKDCRC